MQEIRKDLEDCLTIIIAAMDDEDNQSTIQIINKELEK